MVSDVVREVLASYKQLGRQFDYICCLYPTAPFINSNRIKSGFKLLLESGADAVIPIVRFGYPIQRALAVRNGKVVMVQPENLNKRSQDLEPAFHDAGQFWWMQTSTFLDKGIPFTDHTVGLEIPESEVQDIDNLEDWKLAEIKYSILHTR
jgi:N-acylneuraminate cytidylyltransferase